MCTRGPRAAARDLESFGSCWKRAFYVEWWRVCGPAGLTYTCTNASVHWFTTYGPRKQILERQPNSIPFHSTPLNSTPIHPTQFSIHSIPINSSRFHSIPLQSIPPHSIPFQPVPVNSIPSILSGSSRRIAFHAMPSHPIPPFHPTQFIKTQSSSIQVRPNDPTSARSTVRCICVGQLHRVRTSLPCSAYCSSSCVCRATDWGENSCDKYLRGALRSPRRSTLQSSVAVAAAESQSRLSTAYI